MTLHDEAGRTLRATRCEVHKYHWPRPGRYVIHHIWPLGAGGPDTAGNEVEVCDTGHYSIHAYLAVLQHSTGLGSVPWKVRRKFHKNERRYAEEGWAQMRRAGVDMRRLYGGMGPEVGE